MTYRTFGLSLSLSLSPLLYLRHVDGDSRIGGGGKRVKSDRLGSAGSECCWCTTMRHRQQAWVLCLSPESCLGLSIGALCEAVKQVLGMSFQTQYFAMRMADISLPPLTPFQSLHGETGIPRELPLLPFSSTAINCQVSLYTSTG